MSLSDCAAGDVMSATDQQMDLFATDSLTPPSLTLSGTLGAGTLGAASPAAWHDTESGEHEFSFKNLGEDDLELMDYFSTTVTGGFDETEDTYLRHKVEVAHSPTTKLHSVNDRHRGNVTCTSPSAVKSGALSKSVRRQVELHVLEHCSNPTATLSKLPTNTDGNIKKIHIVKVQAQPNRPTSGSSYVNLSDETESLKSKDENLSRAAVNARENRQRKKQYLASLEDSVSSLTSENKSLKEDVVHMKKTIDGLNNEVEYLSNVLANQSTLSALLKNIHKTPGVQFSSSGLPNRDQPPDSEEDEELSYNGDLERKNTQVGVVPPMKRMIESAFVSDDESKENISSSHEVHPSMKNDGAVNSRSPKIQKLDHDYATATKACSVVLSRNIVTAPLRKDIAVKTSRSGRKLVPTSKVKSAAGVCLHVANNRVSLEFCASCSSKAGKAR